MVLFKVLAFSLLLFATEPEYEEIDLDLQIEPEVIHLDIPWRQRLSIGEVIIDPYAELYAVNEDW